VTTAAVNFVVYRLAREPGRFDIGRSYSVRLIVSAEKRGDSWVAHAVNSAESGMLGTAWSWAADLRTHEREAIEAALDEQLVKDADSDVPALARHAATMGELSPVRGGAL
jgi:hypothetical protein